MHSALRYMPGFHGTPFRSVGGDRSEIGGAQPLRGFGTDRFRDRKSFSASLEIDHQLAHIDAVSTHVELQLTPFIDVGCVFADPAAWGSPGRGGVRRDQLPF